VPRHAQFLFIPEKRRHRKGGGVNWNSVLLQTGSSAKKRYGDYLLDPALRVAHPCIMRLRFHHFKYLVYTVAALLTIIVWLYALLNGASVIDWTIQSERGFSRAWNYAISREGAFIVSSGSIIFVLVVILVDSQRERKIKKWRQLRDTAIKRRLERAKGMGLLSPQSTPIKQPEVIVTEEERRLAKMYTESRGLGFYEKGEVEEVEPLQEVEQRAKLTILDCHIFGASLSPSGRISKSEKGESVAMVEFYREIDETSRPWIEVRAHIEFCDLDGKRLVRLNDGFWYEDHKDVAQLVKFKVADSKYLIIALNVSGHTIVFDGRLRVHRRAMVYFNEFIPDFNMILEGKEFLIRIRLISQWGGKTILDEPFNLKLSTDPMFTITPT
jgi:hypothetical protein